MVRNNAFLYPIETMETEGKFIGAWFYDGEFVPVVEIICPYCGCDRVEPLEGNSWICCGCKQEFIAK
jgi:hypothetical protein